MYKRLFALSLLLGLIAMGVQSQTGLSQTVSFGTEMNPDETLTITGYKGSASEIIIPPAIDGLPVTAIGEFVFSEKGLTSLALSEGLEAIGFFSFVGNNLTSL